MSENFRQKDGMVAGGHTTKTLNSITYLSVVSCDSICIHLTIFAPYEVNVLSCNIQNTYLTAPEREKIRTKTGPKFGTEDHNKIVLVVCAL